MIRPWRFVSGATSVAASVVASATLATIMFSVVGCASETIPPATTAAASPMPSPTLKTDTLASIELGGTALTLVYSDRSLPQQLAYSGDPVLAIAALSKESGETPAMETIVATNCSVTQKQASWGDGLTLTYDTDAETMVGAAAFIVRSDAPQTPGGVVVTTASGFGVGDPISSLIAATPGVVVHGQDTVHPFGLSAYFDLDANEIGAVAISDAKSGLIRLLTAPVGRSQDC